MPLCFAVKYWSRASPDHHSLSDLPGEAVTGTSCDFGSVVTCHSLVLPGLMLLYERFFTAISKSVHMFLASGVQISCRLADVLAGTLFGN